MNIEEKCRRTFFAENGLDFTPVNSYISSCNIVKGAFYGTALKCAPQ